MRLLKIALYFAVSCTALFGQAGTGAITGVITDPAGAVIPGADVEVRNAETNAPYPTVTTGTGNYTVPNLPPGPYSATVTARGFKKLTRTGLTVDAGQIVPLNLALEVGEVNESVLAHNVTLEQLDELPILGIGTANAGSLGIRNPSTRSCFSPASITSPTTT